MQMTEEKIKEIESTIRAHNDDLLTKYIETLRRTSVEGAYDTVEEDFDFWYEYQEWLDFQ